MGDSVDQISQGHTSVCPYCPEKFEDMDPGVAQALRNNHIRREHPFAEERFQKKLRTD